MFIQITLRLLRPQSLCVVVKLIGVHTNHNLKNKWKSNRRISFAFGVQVVCMCVVVCVCEPSQFKGLPSLDCGYCPPFEWSQFVRLCPAFVAVFRRGRLTSSHLLNVSDCLQMDVRHAIRNISLLRLDLLSADFAF